MKPFGKRHLGALLALLLAAALPASVAWAKYAQSMQVTNELELVVGAKHTLTFDANEGEWTGYTYKGKVLVTGQKYGEMPKPTKTNCTFKGWFKEKEPWSDTYVESDTRMEDQDTTLYAHWGGTWNVEIDPNGGTLYVMDGNILPGASESNQIQSDRPTFKVQYLDGAYNNLLIKAVKEGYQCTGYFDQAENGTGTKVWEATGHCIHGDTYYKEMGSPRGALWVNAERAQNGDPFVFYPQWKANTYTVRYNPNYEGADESMTMADSEHTYDEEAPLNQNTFTRPGYTFVGWYTKADADPDATEGLYLDGAEVKNLTSEDGATVTLYAIWRSDETADPEN